MRELAAKNLSHLSPLLYAKEPQVFSEETHSREPQSCRWRPYSHSNEYGANTALVIILLFSFLVCAMSLCAAVRCFLRGGGSTALPLDRIPHTQQEPDQQKPGLNAATSLPVVLTLKYSAGLKLAGAERECPICLSEFEEGEQVKVLARCNHGFHVRCIEQWLSSHFSCPLCRSHILSGHWNSQAAIAIPGNYTADAA